MPIPPETNINGSLLRNLLDRFDALIERDLWFTNNVLVTASVHLARNLKDVRRKDYHIDLGVAVTPPPFELVLEHLTNQRLFQGGHVQAIAQGYWGFWDSDHMIGVCAIESRKGLFPETEEGPARDGYVFSLVSTVELQRAMEHAFDVVTFTLENP